MFARRFLYKTLIKKNNHTRLLATKNIPRTDLSRKLADKINKNNIVGCLGSSGTGRSSVIQTYLDQYSERYDHVLWLNANNEALFFLQIKQMLRKQELIVGDESDRMLIDIAREYFSTLRRAILIIKNVIDIKILEKFINCTIKIIFTHENDFDHEQLDKQSSFPALSTINVPNFTAQESRKLIQQELRLYAIPDNLLENFDPLADALNHHPLAIVLACSYLRAVNSESKIQNYIELLNKDTNSTNSSNSNEQAVQKAFAINYNRFILPQYSFITNSLFYLPSDHIPFCFFHYLVTVKRAYFMTEQAIRWRKRSAGLALFAMNCALLTGTINVELFGFDQTNVFSSSVLTSITFHAFFSAMTEMNQREKLYQKKTMLHTPKFTSMYMHALSQCFCFPVKSAESVQIHPAIMRAFKQHMLFRFPSEDLEKIIGLSLYQFYHSSYSSQSKALFDDTHASDSGINNSVNHDGFNFFANYVLEDKTQYNTSLFSRLSAHNSLFRQSIVLDDFSKQVKAPVINVKNK